MEIKDLQDNYETPQAEEIILLIEEYILDSIVQNGGGEKLLDEDEAGF